MQENVKSLSLEQFLRLHCVSESNLLDKLMLTSHLAPHATVSYESYKSKSYIENGIRNGQIFRGFLNSKVSSWENCYIIVYDGGQRKSIWIEGAANVNRALVGDNVAVEILNSGPPEQIAKILDNENPFEADFRQIEALPDNENPVAQTYGKVVGILKRSMRRYFGSIDPTTAIADVSGGGFLVQVVVVDKSAPRILIRCRSLEEMSQKRVAVSIDSWPADSEFPLGHVSSILGDIGDKEVETDIILNELGISRKEFSTAVMACLPSNDWAITEECFANRMDLRDLPISSVDPPGCKDIDDALHCVKLSNGRWQVGVHIADVTHFVKPGTALDKEAAERSTSTYLVDRRLDMLPSLLTTELCSLRCSEEHLAFSVLWEMDDEANILDVQFGKSVIASKASLTYDQAQVIIDSANGDLSSLETSIKNLNKLAKILKKRRLDAGALTLASPEVRFKLDSESQDPTDLSLYNIKESNSMVEELMLLANITVSKKILKHFPTLGVLRRHQPPSRDQFVPLLLSARMAGFELDITNSRSLADSLDLAVRNDDPMFNKLLRMLATRCMMPAQYFCSGEVSKDQWHHYGLATQVYTHFTSPIRRYADVVVHRLLAASLGIEQLPSEYTDRRQMQELCSHMNKRHRGAQHAQRASVSIYSLIYFKNNPIVENAYVMEILETSVRLMVPKYGIESTVPYSSLNFKAVECVVNEGRNQVDLIDIDRNTFSIQLLQRMTVKVVVEDNIYGLGKVVLRLV
jgi:exosome complex exonuclease DIS3/RRP44